MLFHLIYISDAVAPMSEGDLVDLLHQSRDRNMQHHITGMLLYKDGHFMQVLEGDEASVMAIFADIEVDARHTNVRTLREEYIQFRSFPDWAMGFTNIDTIDPSTLHGFTEFLERDFSAEYFCRYSHEAHAMLLAFKGIAESN